MHLNTSLIQNFQCRTLSLIQLQRCIGRQWNMVQHTICDMSNETIIRVSSLGHSRPFVTLVPPEKRNKEQVMGFFLLVLFLCGTKPSLSTCLTTYYLANTTFFFKWHTTCLLLIRVGTGPNILGSTGHQNHPFPQISGYKQKISWILSQFTQVWCNVLKVFFLQNCCI